MSDPTQGQNAEVVRFWSHRFDHVDHTLETLAHQGRLLTEVVVAVSHRQNGLEAALVAVEERLAGMEMALREV
jgi:hypothetical protein